MGNIRRAAVTGLFAISLALLSAAAAAAPNGSAYRADRPVQAERFAVETRREQEGDRVEGDTTPEA